MNLGQRHNSIHYSYSDNLRIFVSFFRVFVGLADNKRRGVHYLDGGAERMRHLAGQGCVPVLKDRDSGQVTNAKNRRPRRRIGDERYHQKDQNGLQEHAYY